MANLGSDDTPIAGESFGLPSGWSITENAAGEVVIEDSGGNVVFRRDETAGEWVTDSIGADSIDAEDLVSNEKTELTHDDIGGLPGEVLQLITFDSDEIQRKDESGVFVGTTTVTADNTATPITRDHRTGARIHIFGINTTDDGQNFVDTVSLIAFGDNINVTSELSRDPVSRSYSVENQDLAIAIDEDNDDFHIGTFSFGLNMRV